MCIFNFLYSEFWQLQFGNCQMEKYLTKFRIFTTQPTTNFTRVTNTTILPFSRSYKKGLKIVASQEINLEKWPIKSTKMSKLQLTLKSEESHDSQTWHFGKLLLEYTVKMKAALSVVRPALATQLKFKTKIRRGLRSLSAALLLLGRLLSSAALSVSPNTLSAPWAPELSFNRTLHQDWKSKRNPQVKHLQVNFQIK